MLLKILRETLVRRKRRVAVAVLSILVGSSLAAALLTLSSDVADKMSRELKAYGANILVTPSPASAGEAGATGDLAYLDEADLVKLKTIFWRNNIVGFSPFLSEMVAAGPSGERVVLTGTWFDRELSLPPGTAVRSTFFGQSALETGDRFRAGVKGISPWWKVQGQWVSDGDPEGALVGASLAEKLGLTPGARLEVRQGDRRRQLRVDGILSTGGLEENQIFVDLPVAQQLLGVDRGVGQVLVSALVTPEEKIAESIRNKKPEEMTPKEYETWYCTPILESIALQIQEVLPGSQARAIRQISEAEGSFITRIDLLMALVTGLALIASALAVMTTMTTTVLERRPEIGIMKAIGADGWQVASIFLVETAVVGLLGGGLGFLVGIRLAQVMGAVAFGTSPSPNLAVLPITLLLSLAVALVGSALPVRSAMRVQPALLLKG